ncbi:S8 family serine peptidase [Streptomyces sp. NBC_00304]|uniref:S8 family serine peptidase n=1 Tax=Streptomyces sp. NBC_00304 TaxID=2975706 RepID=UPI002E2D04F0|nr:S8 family serine peptidase [Streptomyces sp. NBC_00304]
MNRRRPRWQGLFAAALATAVGAPFLGALPAAAADPGPKPAALLRKADGQVLKALGSKDRVSFWVQLDSQADTSAARKAKKKADKDRAVIEAKTAHADRSQKALRALLKNAGAHYTPYWISNTIEVTGDKALAEKIAARPEVASIRADEAVKLPVPLNATTEPKVNGVEWNIDRINAPKVWNEFGVRGEGVVIGSIDTGVDYRHPALAASYRGLKADGSYDHSYNWFDAVGTCAGDAPCDDYGHGTHTVGSMVGDDGNGNAIGVAPGASWIAAKGCGTESCPQSALLAAGQWMLAPTDADGENPRPDLAPDVINNSWGADSLDTWYQAMVQAWRDAGIFPAFSNGNSGPSCDTAGSPGAYDNTYSSGALDSSDRIADFSARGPGVDGRVKPDIAAPGVNIRSAAPGGGYVAKSGTSMASPHTAATVALIWSAAPSLRGDVAATEALLNDAATDVDATSCGGTAEFNNIYGHGRLDAYAAVSAAPRTNVGALTGTVTADGEPAAEIQVDVDGPMHASVHTKADGTYSLPRLVAGDYRVTVSKFGYVTLTADVTVAEDATVTHDAALTTAPTGTVTGTVTSASGPEADVTVKVQGTPVRVETGADGRYTLTVPVGSYRFGVTPLNHCAAAVGVAVAVAKGANTRNVALASRADVFGTTCRQTTEAYPAGDTRLTLNPPTGSYAPVTLPFPVALYGHTYDKGWVTRDGQLVFGSLYMGDNGGLPSTSGANGALSPFWDQLAMDASSGVYTSVRGSAPHREYVVEWRDMLLARDPSQRIGFAATISEDGTYTFHYKDIGDGAFEHGGGATIGAENHDGTDAFLYSLNERSLRDGTAIRFRPEGHAVVSGTVTDANDGKPVSGATVAVTRSGTAVDTVSTRADGSYLTQIPATTAVSHRISVTAPHYMTGNSTFTLQSLSAVGTATALRTGAVSYETDADQQLIMTAGEQRTRTLTLTNSGAPAAYSVAEKNSATWLKVSPASGSLATGAGKAVTLTFDTTAAKPGTVLTGTLVIASESGRAPSLSLPIEVVVPAYRTGIDVGADTASVDGTGDTWSPDLGYADGSYGYVGRATTPTYTRKDIAGAAGSRQQQLLRSGRQGVTEYRFDAVPNGTYEVELGFAEPAAMKPGQRVFDVTAEGAEKVSDIDVRLESGGVRTALAKTFTVKVTDGGLEVGLSAIRGDTLINSIRVTQRPDLI